MLGGNKVIDLNQNLDPNGSDLETILSNGKVHTLRFDTTSLKYTQQNPASTKLGNGGKILASGSVGDWGGYVEFNGGYRNLSQDNNDHIIDITLSDSVLSGVRFSYGTRLVRDSKSTDAAPAITTHTLSLKGSVINGNVVLQDDKLLSAAKTDEFGNVVSSMSPIDGASLTFVGEKFTLSRDVQTTTNLNLEEGSVWIGNLIAKELELYNMGKPVNKTFDPQVINNIALSNSTWIGHVDTTENDDTNIRLKNSDWVVTATPELKAASTSQGKITIASDKDSLITLSEGVKLNVNKAEGDLNIKFDSLVGTTVAIKDDQTRTTHLIADTMINDGSQSLDNIVNGLQEAYISTKTEGVTFEVQQGLITDGASGTFGENGKVNYQVNRNNNLEMIGQTTGVTMMQWRADADDMAQRMGELRNNDGAVGLWARTYGGKAEAGHISNKYNGIQVGADTQIGAEGVKQFVGGAFSYSKGDASFNNGSGDNYMAALTAYSSWFYEGGSYLDLSAKWGKLNNEFDINHYGQYLSGNFNTHGVAMSIETGHRFPVGTLAYVEPQLAFTASHISGEGYKATQGIKIEQDSIDSYVARVGVQAGLNCPDNVGTLFVRASYLYDFDGETSTTARSSSVQNSIKQDFGGGWYELGVGMNVNFTKNFHGYADFEYVTGGEIKTPYRWNAGVRYTF